jgi:CheY-like chemotaxis protein
MAIASLTRLGYSMDHISVAFDGVEAVALYKASLFKPPEERIHAILMDIWMPNMDGYAATSEITSLANANGEKLTIIAVTADITDECAERAKKVGMQGFVAKPYKVLDIEHLIIDQFEKA